MSELARNLTSPRDASSAAELAAALNAGLAESSATCVAFRNAELAGAAIPADLSDADLLLIEKGVDDLERDALLRLPGWLAAFVPPFGATCSLVLRRSAAEAVGAFRDVSSPIHDWMMRAALQGRKVVRDCDASPMADPATGDVNRPKLRPDEPGRDANWIRDHIMSLEIAGHGGRVASSADAVALKAGLLQLHDFLDASHSQSQSVEGDGRNAAADYWHAIMHRREPDYTNSKYWFRRVGAHPIFPQLTAAAESLLDRYTGIPPQTTARLLHGGDWDPFAFVDFCQSCSQAETDEAALFARQLQWIEMLLLLDQTYRDVIGD